MATDDFFRARLEQMIDLRHPLAVLATRLPWSAIEAALAPKLALGNGLLRLQGELEGGYTVVPAPVKGQIKLFDVDDSLIVPTPEGKDCFDYEYPNRHKKPPKNWDDSYE